MSERRFRWLLGLVGGIGLALRSWNLGASEFWLDELFSYAFTLTPPAELLDPATTLPHSPLFFLLISLVPSSAPDWIFRLPALLAGAATPVLLGWGIRRFRGPGAGLAVALLIALNPLQVYWSREVRMYSLYALLVAGAVVWASWNELKPGLWLVLPLTAFYLFPYTIYYLPWFAWVALHRDSGRPWAWLAGAIGLILAWLLPAVGHAQSAHTPPIFDALTFSTLATFFKQSLAGNYNASLPEFRNLTFPIMAIGLGGAGLGFLLCLRGKERGLRRILLALALPLALYAIVQEFSDSGFTYRSFIPGSILLLVLAGVGLAHLPKRIALFLLAAISACYLLVLFQYFDPTCRYNWNSPRTASPRDGLRAALELAGEGIVYTGGIEVAMAAPRYARGEGRPWLDSAEYDCKILPMEDGFFRRFFERQGIGIGESWMADTSIRRVVVINGRPGRLAEMAARGFRHEADTRVGNQDLSLWYAVGDSPALDTSVAERP